MNSTPPMARLSTSLVLGAVWPMYCPTRSSRVTATRCPLRTWPSRCRIVAMRMATVVLPVPGLPVKHMCSEGFAPSMPSAARAVSTTSSEAISRMRVLTGASPTSSWSSSSSTAPTPDSASSALRSNDWLMPGRSRPLERVADEPPGALLAPQPVAGLLLRTVHDEGEPHGLEASRRVERVQLDVAVRMRLARLAELRHHARRVLQVEHGHAPHLPVGVAGMRIVGVLEGHGPVLSERVLDLLRDLLVREV